MFFQFGASLAGNKLNQHKLVLVNRQNHCFEAKSWCIYTGSKREKKKEKKNKPEQ